MKAWWHPRREPCVVCGHVATYLCDGEDLLCEGCYEWAGRMERLMATTTKTEVRCHICKFDITEFDVLYHYARNHEINPPTEVLVLGLMSAYETVQELGQVVEKLKARLN